MSTNSIPALEGVEHRFVGGGVTIHITDAPNSPKLGEHIDDVLRRAGCRPQIEHLRAGGAVA
jgi:hypothetical protein